MCSKKCDWQTIANITTSITLIVAILVFGWEIYQYNKTQEFSIFLKFDEAYTKIVKERSEIWSKIKETVISNPKTKHEIPDNSNTIDYLKLRISQKEPLYAVELALIEHEIKSMNILNELCRLSLNDKQKISLLKASYSDEIAFYQNNIQNIEYLRNEAKKELRIHERKDRWMSIIRYADLQKIKIDDFFAKE